MRAIVGFLLICLLTSHLFGQTSNGQKSYRDQYGVLSERNMFVKDRVRGRGDDASTQPTSRPSETPLTPEETYVLRGVIFENDVFTAYFENLASSRIEVASVGSELAQIRIVDIALDAVELDKSGQTQWISIGHDLRGSPGRTRGGATAGATGNSIGGAAPGTETTSDPGTLSIEERMRQRRAAERGGR